MHPARRACLLTLALIAATGSAAARLQAQADATPTALDWRSVRGCYRSRDWHFALDSVPFVGVFSIEDEARLLRSSRPSYREMNWHPIGPDSIRLVFEGGMHGIYYRLAVRGDTLAGIVTDKNDISIARPLHEKAVAVREPCLPDSAYSTLRPDSARAATLLGYGAARPTEAQTAADPWGSVAPLRAWLQANPEAAGGFTMWRNARVLFERAANADVQANFRELAGTYRMEIERTGGPTLVFYGRTEIRPRNAVMQIDSAAPWADHSHGYLLRFTLARDTSTLPQPGPGRRHRDPFGSSFSPSNSEIVVRLPAVDTAGGARRFRGYVMLVNFIFALRDQDAELTRWEHDWFDGNFRDDAIPDVTEFVTWPDGRVTFTHREELAPDRVVTLRGERISPVAWECSGTQC
jgi:hypothetical protein